MYKCNSLVEAAFLVNTSKQCLIILKRFKSNTVGSKTCYIKLLTIRKIIKIKCRPILNDCYVNISRAIGEPDCMVNSGYNRSNICMCLENHSSGLFIKHGHINDVELFKFRLVIKEAITTPIHTHIIAILL